MKKLILLFALLFLLFPLFHFASHGRLVGDICCEASLFVFRNIYHQFAPTSLIIGLFLLAIFSIKPIKKGKDFLWLTPFIIPIAVLVLMVYSSISYASKLEQFRECSNVSMEWRATGGFENIDKATVCLQNKNTNYEVEFGDHLIFKGPTNYFPFLIQ